MVAAACLLIATAVLGLEPFTRVNDVAAVLAGLIIVAVAVRMVLVSVQEAKLLRQLADNEAQFRRLIETAAEGIVITDTEGRCILANERFADLTGYSPEDWIGRPVPEAVPACGLPHCRRRGPCANVRALFRRVAQLVRAPP